jgi:F0F1-type ATP synthase membrane subunit b/b'
METHFDFVNAVGIPYFNFAVFVILFIVFFRKTLTAMAQARRERYLSASKDAASALEASQAAFNEVKSRFDSLESELKSFKQQSEHAATQEAKRILEETERFTKQLKEETNRLAGEAVAQARQELRHEMVLAAKAIAEKQMTSDLDAATKDKILNKKISEASVMTVQ